MLPVDPVGLDPEFCEVEVRNPCPNTFYKKKSLTKTIFEKKIGSSKNSYKRNITNAQYSKKIK